jgi:3'(2'), 5'-bisphosphate nucleotidase
MVHQIITPALEGILGPSAMALVGAAVRGGRAILAAGKPGVEIKPDGTPVTAADIASHGAILSYLATSLPDLPVISEEGTEGPGFKDPDQTFILVDPLDGTKDYLAGHEDYAVCLALMQRQRPVAGVILAPAQRKLWVGAIAGAWVIALTPDLTAAFEPAHRLRLSDQSAHPKRVVISRSHPDRDTRMIAAAYAGITPVEMGAALKFAAIADGTACLYPRAKGARAWDVAAGEAIITAAGGTVLGRKTALLGYGIADGSFMTDGFVAAANTTLAAHARGQWPAN